jgi:hypothetical protein
MQTCVADRWGQECSRVDRSYILLTGGARSALEWIDHKYAWPALADSLDKHQTIRGNTKSKITTMSMAMSSRAVRVMGVH